MDDTKRLPRWYFGGLASAMSVCFTHPLDTLKVQLQTQQTKVPLARLTVDLIRREGVLALYNGLSASVFRQLTYSTTRFAIYDMAKIWLGKDSTFMVRVGVASIAGAIGGFVGTPTDKVNVRMQNDTKLPKEKRLNYKHVFDGLWRVYRDEGFSKLFSGGAAASGRAAFMGVGQLSFYDQLKLMLLETSYFADNLTTHFTASLGAAGIATTITQPLDVLKTRIMNARPGEFNSIMDVVLYTAKEGPLGFFKGFAPAFLRIGPQTILTFVFYEQLRLNFGVFPENKNN